MLEMLDRQFKSFCKQYEETYSKLKLDNEQWTLIEEIVLCLGPSAVATLKLQAENVTLTDIYKILNICLMETHEIGMEVMKLFKFSFFF